MLETEYQDIFEALMKRTENCKFTTKVRSGIITIFVIPIIHFDLQQIEVLTAIAKRYGLTFFITGNTLDDTGGGAMAVLK